MARTLNALAKRHDVRFIFKASYDKANRTSLDSYRGPGIGPGLHILAEIRAETGAAVLTDVHTVEEAERAGEVVDVVQIPAFLCRQTDLLRAAAETGKTVNVKKGQFLAPGDMAHVVAKLERFGAGANIWLTERGSTFGYNDLVVDFRSIPIMQRTGHPVILDVTHSVQTPGGEGAKSGGRPEFIPTLAAAGIAAGADGLFMEVHDNPPNALSDGANALDLELFDGLLSRVLKLWEAVG